MYPFNTSTKIKQFYFKFKKIWYSIWFTFHQDNVKLYIYIYTFSKQKQRLSNWISANAANLLSAEESEARKGSRRLRRRSEAKVMNVIHIGGRGEGGKWKEFFFPASLSLDSFSISTCALDSFSSPLAARSFNFSQWARFKDFQTSKIFSLAYIEEVLSEFAWIFKKHIFCVCVIELVESAFWWNERFFSQRSLSYLKILKLNVYNWLVNVASTL